MSPLLIVRRKKQFICLCCFHSFLILTFPPLCSRGLPLLYKVRACMQMVPCDPPFVFRKYVLYLTGGVHFFAHSSCYTETIEGNLRVQEGLKGKPSKEQNTTKRRFRIGPAGHRWVRRIRSDRRVQMKGYSTDSGYMGYVDGVYILFACEGEYLEYVEQ